MKKMSLIIVISILIFTTTLISCSKSQKFDENESYIENVYIENPGSDLDEHTYITNLKDQQISALINLLNKQEITQIKDLSFNDYTYSAFSYEIESTGRHYLLKRLNDKPDSFQIVETTSKGKVNKDECFGFKSKVLATMLSDIEVKCLADIESNKNATEHLIFVHGDIKEILITDIALSSSTTYNTDRQDIIDEFIKHYMASKDYTDDAGTTHPKMVEVLLTDNSTLRLWYGTQRFITVANGQHQYNICSQELEDFLNRIS